LRPEGQLDERPAVGVGADLTGQTIVVDGGQVLTEWPALS
jgi:hypothetical protein